MLKGRNRPSSAVGRGFGLVLARMALPIDAASGCGIALGPLPQPEATPFRLRSYAVGSVTVKVVPEPLLLQVMSPACSRAVSRAMARPRPKPPVPDVRALSVR